MQQMSPWRTLLFVETLTANIVAATNGFVPSPTLVKKSQIILNKCTIKEARQMLMLGCVQIHGLSTVYKQQEPAGGRNVQNSWLIKAGRMQAVGPTGRKLSSAQ